MLATGGAAEGRTSGPAACALRRPGGRAGGHWRLGSLPGPAPLAESRRAGAEGQRWGERDRSGASQAVAQPPAVRCAAAAGAEPARGAAGRALHGREGARRGAARRGGLATSRRGKERSKGARGEQSPACKGASSGRQSFLFDSGSGRIPSTGSQGCLGRLRWGCPEAVAGQLLHREGAAAESHNHSNRISTTAAAAAAKAASSRSSSRQPGGGDLRPSSQVPRTPKSVRPRRCQC
jgi:hypothetical protein